MEYSMFFDYAFLAMVLLVLVVSLLGAIICSIAESRWWRRLWRIKRFH